MIRLDDKGSKERIYDMWHRIFHDPPAYMDFYFDRIYSRNAVLTKEDGEGRIQGMLHLNPYTLLIRGQACLSHYIVGVATEEDCRRQGIMRQLLTVAMARLREDGEALTYLMPADPAYYLPFGFRFGADWLEAELRLEPGLEEAGDSLSTMTFSVHRLTEEEARAAGEGECLSLKTSCSLATATDSSYLQCLEDEAASEHARVYYLYENGKYAGRFVMGTADDYMMLSRIVCCLDDRALFLKQILKFCQDTYHYGAYHITLDESWQEALKNLAATNGVRIMAMRRKPMIMFRILALDQMGPYLRSEADFKLRLRVLDESLPDQDGLYLMESSAENVVIKKQEAGQEEDRIPDGGVVTISDLTSILFGRLKASQTVSPSALTEEGADKLGKLCPFFNNCVMEYV